MNPLLVIVGMPGSGKSTLVRHLEKKGWPAVHFGQITMDEVKRLNLPPTQASEKQAREALRQKHGSAVYAELSLKTIQANLQKSVAVVDGLYSWDEYTYLKSKIPNPFYVVAVCADRGIRYARLANRRTRSLPPAEAEARDIAEITKLQKGGPIAIADFTLVNNGTEQDLVPAIERVLQQIWR